MHGERSLPFSRTIYGGPPGLVLRGEIGVKLCNAGAAEVQELVIADLAFDELLPEKALPADRASLFVDVFRRLSLFHNGLEAKDGNGKNHQKKPDRKNCHTHPFVSLVLRQHTQTAY